MMGDIRLLIGSDQTPMDIANVETISIPTPDGGVQKYGAGIIPPIGNLKYVIPVLVTVTYDSGSKTLRFGENGKIKILRSNGKESVNMVLYPKWSPTGTGGHGYTNGYVNVSIQPSMIASGKEGTIAIYTVEYSLYGGDWGLSDLRNFHSYISQKSTNSFLGTATLSTITDTDDTGYISAAAGEWTGFIFVYDTDYAGPPKVRKENTYITGGIVTIQ